MQILNNPISALNVRESPKFSRNTMVTSDFIPEMEIRPFCACTMKNMQYNPRLFMAKLPKSSCHLGNRGRGTRWWRQILDRKWKYGHFAHAQWKICNINLIYGRIAQIFASLRKSGSRSDFSPEVEIQPFRECAMHPAIVIGTVRSLWTWLWGRYHVSQNAFLVGTEFYFVLEINKRCSRASHEY